MIFYCCLNKKLNHYFKFETLDDVLVLNPEGLEEPVKVLEMENGVFECNYYPIMMGKYTVTITWGGHSIPRR